MAADLDHAKLWNPGPPVTAADSRLAARWGVQHAPGPVCYCSNCHDPDEVDGDWAPWDWDE
jgi:hypothetical protein